MLFEFAIEQERYANFLRSNPHLVHEPYEEYDARRLAQKALLCAIWLEERLYIKSYTIERGGTVHGGLHTVGCFYSANAPAVHAGLKIQVDFGADVRSFNPARKQYQNKSAAKFKVAHVHNGYVDLDHHVSREGSCIRNAEVVWAGRGGYWNTVEINAVRNVSA